MKYIIRADHYDDGTVVPIGITNEKGDSYIVRTLKKRINIETGAQEFDCIVNEKGVTLSIYQNKWTVQEEKQLNN